MSEAGRTVGTTAATQNPLHNSGIPQDLLRTLESSLLGPSQDVHKTLLGLLQGPLRPPQDLLELECLRISSGLYQDVRRTLPYESPQLS